MRYIKLEIAIEEEYQESLIAELSELEFDAFEQLDGSIVTYVSKERFSDVSRERIEQMLINYPGEGYIRSEEVVADRNWNREWERTIRPQTIGPFYIKPTWSKGKAPSGSMMLEIDPKMAFGTGYHETTRLMLEFLPSVVQKDDFVLDAGTGSGILAIASVKLGAKQVFAFDIDNWSITNTKENIHLNNVVDQVIIRKGSSEAIPEHAEYDLILANIERNTIVEMLPDFKRVSKADTRIILSGLLKTDEQLVLDKVEAQGLAVKELRQENEWIAIHCEVEKG